MKGELGTTLLVGMYLGMMTAAHAEEPKQEKIPAIEAHLVKPERRMFDDSLLKNLKVPDAFQVNVFAQGLQNPRMMAVAADGTPGDAVKALLDKQGKSTAPAAVGNIENRNIAGPGGEIPVRIYTPKGAGPFPVIVYYHGGGWVIANLDTYDASARALANEAKSIVVSSHYRQAPEHKFPAAVDDAYTAYRWTLANADNINGDAKNISVAGESAGGNLATVVARKARDENIQMPVHQLLIYPVTNYAFDTESYKENANAKPLNAAMMKWFWGHYLKTPADGANPDASPLRAKDLKGLPPATVITAEVDPLRSEGKAYADRLREAGVDVEYKNYEGMPHEFFGMTAVLEDSRDAVQLAADDLPDAVGRSREVRSADVPNNPNAEDRPTPAPSRSQDKNGN